MTTQSSEMSSARVFDNERRTLTFGILLTVAAFAVEGMGVVPALPTAVAELGGTSLFGWAFSAFMLAWLAGTVAGGLLGDAWGPARPMAIGLAAFGTGLGLAGSAKAITLFLLGRAFQGAGGGAMIAAAYVAMARAYPDALRPRMMAITSSVWILPGIVGPAASGIIAERFGWRVVFWGLIPFVCMVAIVVLPPMMRFSVKRKMSDRSRLVAALSLAGGGALLLAVPSVSSFASSCGADVPRWMVQAAAPAELVFGASLVVRGWRALLPAGTLGARPGLPAGLAVRGLLAFSFFGTEAFVPLGSAELRGVSPTQAGIALTAGAVGWVASAWLQDGVEKRFGSAKRAAVVQVGFVLLALGVAGVALVLLGGLSVLLVPAGWLVAGAGMGLAYSAVGLVCIAAAPEGKEGEVAAQLQLAEALCTASGAGMGGALRAALVNAGWSARQAHGAVFAVTLSAAIVGVLVAPRLRAPRGVASVPAS